MNLQLMQIKFSGGKQYVNELYSALHKILVAVILIFINHI